MLGARPDPLAPTDEERQHALCAKEAAQLHSILTALSLSLGHWSADAPQSLEGCGGAYHPALRFEEGLGDLRRLLVQAGAEGGASEEVAREIERSGLVQKHLAPLFCTVPLAGHLPALLVLLEIFLVLTAEQPRWEFQEEQQRQRRVLKKVLGQRRVQERVLAVLVHCVSPPRYALLGGC